MNAFPTKHVALLLAIAVAVTGLGFYLDRTNGSAFLLGAALVGLILSLNVWQQTITAAFYRHMPAMPEHVTAIVDKALLLASQYKGEELIRHYEAAFAGPEGFVLRHMVMAEIERRRILMLERHECERAELKKAMKSRG